jgi:hypothetical protein
MKYIKSYEAINDNYNYAKVGDYIILNKYTKSELLRPTDILYIWMTFLQNTIGKVKKKYHLMSGDDQIVIEYEPKDVPRDLQNRGTCDFGYLSYIDGKYQRLFDYNNEFINYSTTSDDIEKLKQTLTQNKYNL